MAIDAIDLAIPCFALADIVIVSVNVGVVAITEYAPTLLPIVKMVEAIPRELVTGLVSDNAVPNAEPGFVLIANFTGVPVTGVPNISVILILMVSNVVRITGSFVTVLALAILTGIPAPPCSGPSARTVSAAVQRPFNGAFALVSVFNRVSTTGSYLAQLAPLSTERHNCRLVMV